MPETAERVEVSGAGRSAHGGGSPFCRVMGPPTRAPCDGREVRFRIANASSTRRQGEATQRCVVAERTRRSAALLAARVHERLAASRCRVGRMIIELGLEAWPVRLALDDEVE